MSDFTTVDTQQAWSAPDDAAQATQPGTPDHGPVAQEHDDTLAISEVLGQAAGSAEAAQGAQQPQGQPAPGTGTQADDLKVDSGFQGRVNAMVQKEVESVTRKIREEYEAKYAPLEGLAERMLGMEADELVASGKVTDKEMALEYLRMKKGQPPQAATEAAPAQDKPRDDKGRFTKTANPEAERRATALRAEAERIMASGGPNVWEIFNTNEEARNRVVREGWSFAEMALTYGKSAKPQEEKHVPAPVRNPNHTSTPRSFTDMSYEELARFEKSVREGGARYNLQK